MLIEGTSKYLLKKTRAKAKMYEYLVPEDLHIEIEDNIPELLLIAIGTIGDVSAEIVRSNNANLIKEKEVVARLEFASSFFDAFLNSKIDNSSEYYYYLLGSVAYYLSGKLGSSQVLIKKIEISELDLDCNGMDVILANSLKKDYRFNNIKNEYQPHYDFFNGLSEILSRYRENEIIDDIDSIHVLRSYIYEHGSSLEMLLIDSLFAIIIIKQNNLAIKVLPEFSQIKHEMWKKSINEGNLIKELWPSQLKLGEEGVYRGISSVIQMATGTGKTKAISLIIYSAFLSERSNFSIVVAPFRALCREIVYDLEKDFKFDKKIKIEQLSDILRIDDMVFEVEEDDSKSVVVVTPEKLMFVIRQQPELLEKIDQIIFDEAHLFDDSHRGTSYELLVSVIRKYLRVDTQKILISAVMSNAEQLNEWINSGEGVVISDDAIKSTEKQVAFTDWQNSGGKKFGYLYFVDSENPDVEEFYVPRLINISKLSRKSRERKERFFPELDRYGKVKHNDISIHYGIHLCVNGAAAIFCGRKDTANKILERILELESRDYDITSILDCCDRGEVGRISKLIEDNYGKENIYYSAALKGAFVHHSGISNGLKLSIEYAMQKSLISFIVCTSTLAQGVNLPIRYLIVTNLYQGREHISVRDFHNLIGRAGRSGVFTEGSILLTETGIYNSKNAYNNWKWHDYKRILDSNNSEPCLSTLIDLVKDYNFSQDRRFNFFDIIKNYYTNQEEYSRFKEWINELSIDISDQLRFIHSSLISTLDSIESFILSYMVEKEDATFESILVEILEGTYGYYLANDQEKEKLTELFIIIGNYIIENIDDKEKRMTYSRSLLGVKQNQIIELWLIDNRDILDGITNELQIFEIVAPLLFKFTDAQKVKRIEKIQCFIAIGKMWISGNSYGQILEHCEEFKYNILSRNRLKQIDLNDIIEICDKGLGYSTILLITGLAELFSSIDEYDETTYKSILNLSSELRYGLPDSKSILLYEIGFSDRVIAQRMSDEIHIPNLLDTKRLVMNYLGQKKEEVLDIIKEYPQVFIDRIINL